MGPPVTLILARVAVILKIDHTLFIVQDIINFQNQHTQFSFIALEQRNI